ncbi:MAG: transglutaminase domain-containing protein [Bacteroidales bacterium]|nr:transglutaminase domain-containing protein [Bacteroidales bacterium]
MKYRPIFATTIVTLCLIVQISLFSQNDRPSIAELYPDEDVIVQNSESIFTFDLEKDGTPIAVIEETDSRFLALKEDVSALELLFYNKYAEIKKHKVSGTGIFFTGNSQRCGDYERDGIFYHDARVCEFLLRFNKPGEYLNVLSTKIYNNITYFSRISLTKPYGVKNLTVRVEIPENMDVELLEMNFERWDIERSESKGKNGEQVITYRVSDMPPSYNVGDMPGFTCAYPHLVVLMKSYRKEGRKVNIFENTDDLYNWYKKLVKEETLEPELAALTDQLVSGISNDTTRIEKVYQWIQNKIRYVAFEDGYAAYVPDNPNTVYANTYGDCKGMANLAKTMLRHLGYDARLCWTYSGTTCYPRYLPTMGADNHMICAVKTGKGFMFLDPTVKYGSINDVPETIQGKLSIVQDGENYLLETIPPAAYNVNLQQINNKIELRDGELLLINGKLKLQGSPRIRFQYFINQIMWEDKKEIIDYFVTRNDNNFKLLQIEAPPPDSIASEYEINYEIELSNAVIDLGDEMLVSLDFYNEYKNAEIDTTRKFDLELSDRELIDHQVTFILPENMEIGNLPDPVLIETPKFKFSAGYEQSGNSIVYRKQLALMHNIIAVEDFREWNAAIKALAKFYNEMLILKKI